MKKYLLSLPLIFGLACGTGIAVSASIAVYVRSNQLIQTARETNLTLFEHHMRITAYSPEQNRIAGIIIDDSLYRPIVVSMGVSSSTRVIVRTPIIENDMVVGILTAPLVGSIDLTTEKTAHVSARASRDGSLVVQTIIFEDPRIAN